MNVAEVMRGLRRRWYIVVPGLLLALATAVGAWFVVEPGYERSATQLLLPGARSMPEEGNPFLFLGGLTNAADVLVRAVGSENVMNEIEDEHPGVEMEVTRDGSTAGPVILIKVTAPSDGEAGVVLESLVARTSEVLEQLQKEEGITAENRMTVLPVTIDESSVPQQRDRYLAVALAGIGVALVAILVASLVDGLALQRRRRGARKRARARAADADATTDAPAADDGETPADDDKPPADDPDAGQNPDAVPVPEDDPGRPRKPAPGRPRRPAPDRSLAYEPHDPDGHHHDDVPIPGWEPARRAAASDEGSLESDDGATEPGGADDTSDPGREHSEAARSR